MTTTNAEILRVGDTKAAWTYKLRAVIARSYLQDWFELIENTCKARSFLLVHGYKCRPGDCFDAYICTIQHLLSPNPVHSSISFISLSCHAKIILHSPPARPSLCRALKASSWCSLPSCNRFLLKSMPQCYCFFRSLPFIMSVCRQMSLLYNIQVVCASICSRSLLVSADYCFGCCIISFPASSSSWPYLLVVLSVNAFIHPCYISRSCFPGLWIVDFLDLASRRSLHWKQLHSVLVQGISR